MMASRRSALAVCLAVAALFATATAKVNPNLTDKLVEMIKKKNFDGFVKEMGEDAMDVNQPDSRGRLPIVEAVRTREIKFVDSLLQYGAVAKSKDPATGATGLHVAFQQNLPMIAKQLLAYGADPNAEDKAGKRAREFAPSKEIRELISLYDQGGAMAFEDEPGTWIKDKKEGNKEFWHNTKTKESRWNTPPQCAWQAVEVQGHPHKFINAITGQEVKSIPPALAWTKLRKDGHELWYNYKANSTQYEKPDELPSAMAAEIEKSINTRWYNEKTGTYSWTNPVYSTPWRELKDDSTKPERTYWFNIETGESTWELPNDMAWTKIEHESGQPYYFNRITGDSTWEAPEHMAWVRHDSDL